MNKRTELSSVNKSLSSRPQATTVLVLGKRVLSLQNDEVESCAIDYRQPYFLSALVRSTSAGSCATVCVPEKGVDGHLGATQLR